MDPERKRLAAALVLSLVVHALLLSLTFGGHGPGLPGFDFPWRERRIEAPELQVVIVPAPVTAERPEAVAAASTPQPATIEWPVDEGQALALLEPVAAPQQPTPDAVEAEVRPVVRPMPKAEAEAPVAIDAEVSPSAERLPDLAPAPTREPDLIAMERAEKSRWVVPVVPALPTPVVAAPPSAPSAEPAPPATADAGEELRKRVELEAQRRAEQLEAQRAEATRLEAERQEAAQQAAARQVAARQEAARQEAARVEAARLEAERQEVARQATVRQETARLEAARQEAARQEAARQETARQEAARQEAARAESARAEGERHAAAQQAAALRDAALQAARQADERREAARRAMGRQLDEEAAQREAAAKASRAPGVLPPSWSSARRARLFGRTDPNAELILYAEAWARKIQLNLTFDMVREAAKQPHAAPLVTVAIRRDGSVESVTFVVSSGVAEIDDAIRRIVQSQVPYQAFPPGLARDYDVVEIRRSWHFDMAIRLH